jgi:metal-responsive CopG/Arc/MetJ family transcriptional regulator
MFGSVKISIDKPLFDRLKECAERAGYASVEELVRHALEKEAQQIEASPSEDEIKKRLKGLGYLS